MTVEHITETMTNPGTGVIVGGSTVIANLAGSLPVLINISVAVYFILMVIHKIYQMRKEYKEDHPKKETGDSDASSE